MKTQRYLSDCLFCNCVTEFPVQIRNDGGNTVLLLSKSKDDNYDEQIEKSTTTKKRIKTTSRWKASDW